MLNISRDSNTTLLILLKQNWDIRGTNYQQVRRDGWISLTACLLYTTTVGPGPLLDPLKESYTHTHNIYFQGCRVYFTTTCLYLIATANMIVILNQHAWFTLAIWDNHRPQSKVCDKLLAYQEFARILCIQGNVGAWLWSLRVYRDVKIQDWSPWIHHSYGKVGRDWAGCAN